MIGVCAFLLIHPRVTTAADNKTDVKLDGASLQDVLDRLFGTPATPGLLQGDKPFELHAENLVLTSAQADLFFAPSPTNTSDVTDLITAAEQTKGANVKIEGTVDGAPFELKLSGKQAKAEGLVLTQAEWDALLAQLKTMPGLHEAKIEATVDGKMLEAKLENMAGRVKIEDRELHNGAARSNDSNRGAAKLNAANHGNSLERVDHIEKPEKIERPEKVERIERPEKIERIDLPEVARGGTGRH
jgi:hypothetical protein